MTPAFILLLAMPIQEPKVTLDLPATPLTKVLAEISRQTGTSHRIAGPTHLQFVYVKVADLSLSRTREALARVTDGSWKEVNGVWNLTRRDSKLVADLEFQIRVKEWDSRLLAPGDVDSAKMEANLRQSVTLAQNITRDPGTWQKLNDLEEHRPEVRLFRSLIRSLDLKHFVSITEGERRVFALKPTSLQQPSSANSKELVANFWKERLLHLETLERLYPEDIRDTWPDSEIENPLIDPYSWIGTKLPPTDFHLAVKRSYGLLRFDFCTYDANGSVHFRYITNSGRNATDLYNEFESIGKLPSSLDSLNQPLAVTEEDRSLSMKFVSALVPEFAAAWNIKFQKPNQNEKDILLRLDRQDLLSKWPSRMLDQLAEVKKKQVVAVLHDEAIFGAFLMSIMSGKQTLGLAIKGSFGMTDKELSGYSEDEDLITIRPSIQLTDSADVYFDRFRAGELVRSVENQNIVLEAIAKLAAFSRSLNQTRIPLLAAEILGDTTASQVQDYNFEILRFYGQLSAAEQKVAKEGGLSFSLNRTSPNILAALQKLILETDVYHFHVKSAELDPTGNINREEVTIYEREPTVWLSNIDFKNCHLKLSILEERHLLFRSNDGIYPARYGNVPRILANQELNPKVQKHEEQGFYNGVSRTLDLRLILPDKRAKVWRAYFHSVDPKGLKLSLEDLPSALKEEIKRSKANELDWQKKNQVGGDGAKPPPEFMQTDAVSVVTRKTTKEQQK